MQNLYKWLKIQKILERLSNTVNTALLKYVTVRNATSQVMLERSEYHVKRREIFCTKQIKKYIVDLEFASSTSV